MELTAATPQEIMDTLAIESAKRRVKQQGLMTVFLGVMIGLAFLMIFFAKKHQGPDLSSIVPILIAVMGSGVAFTSSHKAALKEASRLATREAAGFLLEAYVSSEEKEVTAICRAALPESLSLVQSPDDFDDFQRGLLNKVMVARYPIQVVAAAVECAGRISGAEAIPALEKIHFAALKKKQPEWQRLGNRALQVLPDVRMRVARKIIEKRVGEAQSSTLETMARIQTDSDDEPLHQEVQA